MIPWWAWLILGAVALQRVYEMDVSRRHTEQLLARGGRLEAQDGYAAIVAVHVFWFSAFAAEGAWAVWAQVGWWTAPLLALFAAGQALRFWTRRTLGTRWTTRVVVLPGKPLVDRGPFRWMRHPNYVGVRLELLALPLAFGLWTTAIAVTLLNAWALQVRIAREDAALGEAVAQG